MQEGAAPSAQNKIRHPVMDRPEVADRSLLERMGLPAGAIRNIIMHRDIVPRAFACDYKLVADLLARVGDGFREHGCLQNTQGRQVTFQNLPSISASRIQPDPSALTSIVFLEIIGCCPLQLLHTSASSCVLSEAGSVSVLLSV